MPQPEREILTQIGVVSILILPIWVGGKWHGFISFNDTVKPREWNKDDIRLLKTASQMFGSYLDRKMAEDERTGYLQFLENMEQVDRAIQGSTDIEQVLWNVMKTVQSIYDCDRAWLLYPCDPNADTFTVPIEYTRPEYPGACALGVELPIKDTHMMDLCKYALEVKAPFALKQDSEYSLPLDYRNSIQHPVFAICRSFS